MWKMIANLFIIVSVTSRVKESAEESVSVSVSFLASRRKRLRLIASTTKRLRQIAGNGRIEDRRRALKFLSTLLTRGRRVRN